MAQQLINVGVVANDRTGDTWRSAFEKVNANETELFDLVNTVTGTVYIAQESDFPTQSATEITLDVNTEFHITTDFSTSKNIKPLNGSSWTSGSIDGAKVTFTGTGTMFSGTDVSFFIHDANLDPGIGNEVFSFTDTVGGAQNFIQTFVRADNCNSYGSFSGMFAVQIENSNCPNANYGVTFSGTTGTIFSFTKFALTSTSASFKGIDLGSSTATVIEFENLFFIAPAGAFGISGLVSNGNIPAGRLGMVQGCEFLGGMTDLENISIDDYGWLYTGNNPTPDTHPDGLLSLTGNATATTLSAATPALISGTWVIEDTSQFTGTTAGRLTYNGERDLKVPVEMAADVEPVSGTNKDLKIYLAFNGTAITQTGRLARVDSGSPQSKITIWQVTFSQNDYIEGFVESADGTNVLVSGAVLRLN